jgi:hypothetical protein
MKDLADRKKGSRCGDLNNKIGVCCRDIESRGSWPCAKSLVEDNAEKNFWSIEKGPGDYYLRAFFFKLCCILIVISIVYHVPFFIVI